MLFTHRRLLRNLHLFFKEFVRILWSGHRQAHALVASTFFRTRTTYLRFSHHTNFLPKFYVGSTEQSVLDREYNRYRKFLQLRHDRLVLSEVALRYWEQNDNLFQWSPIPINTDPHNFRAFELALIQEWQPPLNFPFINQFYHPRKGLLRRAPLAQTQQFGFRRLWRQARWKTTSSQVRRALHSPTFQSRLQSWTTLHHLGSNTKRRYLTEQHLRSNAGGVIKCYALRRLAIHLQEPHRSLALQSLDRTISFWKGKKAPKAFSFRGLWLLIPNLSKRIRSFLVSWYHSNRHLTIPFHKPSVKVIYTKHPTVGEYLYTHKKAVQLWSTSSTPSCTCDLLRRFPEAVIPGTEHVVLDASKISHSFNLDELATLTGSMNNKFFPSFHQCCNAWTPSLATSTIGLAAMDYPRSTCPSNKRSFPDFGKTMFHILIPPYPTTPSHLFRNNFRGASSIVKTRKLPLFGSSALNYTLHASRTPSWIPRYFHQFLFRRKSASPPTSWTSPTSSAPSTLGHSALVANYQLATCSPRRRSFTTVAALS